MHFATPRQMIAIALAWALLLVAYDQHANPRSMSTYWAELRGSSIRPTVVSLGDSPRVRLSMPHLCCAAGLGEITDAFKPLTWLGPARVVGGLPSDPHATPTDDSMKSYDVDFDILDLTKADFAALDRALRGTGLVPERIEISGMGHFRLEVELPHLCCTVCSKAVDEQLERLIRKETQGRWLDSMTTDHVKKTVVIYARMNAVVDIVELTNALGHAGFSAHAIRVLTGPES